MPSETIPLRILLKAYEDGEFDFLTLVHLAVQRFLEVGPHQDNPEHEGWSDHLRGEQVPDSDNGTWINMAVAGNVLTHQQALQLRAAIHEALTQN